MAITVIIAWLTSAAKILKDTGANEAVKQGAKSIFAWLSEKFESKREQDEIVAIKENPDNGAAIKSLEEIVSYTQKFNTELFDALQEQINQFAILVKDKMPEASSIVNTEIKKSQNFNTGTISHIKGNIHIGNEYSTKDTKQP